MLSASSASASASSAVRGCWGLETMRSTATASTLGANVGMRAPRPRPRPVFPFAIAFPLDRRPSQGHEHFVRERLIGFGPARGRVVAEYGQAVAGGLAPAHGARNAPLERVR